MQALPRVLVSGRISCKSSPVRELTKRMASLSFEWMAVESFPSLGVVSLLSFISYDIFS